LFTIDAAYLLLMTKQIRDEDIEKLRLYIEDDYEQCMELEVKPSDLLLQCMDVLDSLS